MAKKVKEKKALRGGVRKGFALNTVRVTWYSALHDSAWGEAGTESAARKIAASHWFAIYAYNPHFEKVVKISPGVLAAGKVTL